MRQTSGTPGRLVGDQNGQDWADIIDFLTMYPKARREVVRLLGEIGAAATS
jgi:hypothetical protein